MTHLLDMGAYAGFVWPAYGVTMLGLGAAIGFTWRAYAKARARLAVLEKP